MYINDYQSLLGFFRTVRKPEKGKRVRGNIRIFADTKTSDKLPRLEMWYLDEEHILTVHPNNDVEFKGIPKPTHARNLFGLGIRTDQKTRRKALVSYDGIKLHVPIDERKEVLRLWSAKGLEIRRKYGVEAEYHKDLRYNLKTKSFVNVLNETILVDCPEKLKEWRAVLKATRKALRVRTDMGAFNSLLPSNPGAFQHWADHDNYLTSLPQHDVSAEAMAKYLQTQDYNKLAAICLRRGMEGYAARTGYSSNPASKYVLLGFNAVIHANRHQIKVAFGALELKEKPDDGTTDTVDSSSSGTATEAEAACA